MDELEELLLKHLDMDHKMTEEDDLGLIYTGYQSDSSIEIDKEFKVLKRQRDDDNDEISDILSNENYNKYVIDFLNSKLRDNQGFSINNDSFYIKTSSQELKDVGITFMRPHIQRTIDNNIIEKRIQDNIRKYNSEERVCDFYDIKVACFEGIEEKILYLMDGQHRVIVLQQLLDSYNINVEFVLQIKKLKIPSNDSDKEEKLVQHFVHINNCRPVNFDTCTFSVNEKTVIESLTTYFTSQGLVSKEGSKMPKRPFINQTWICKMFKKIKEKKCLGKKSLEVDDMMSIFQRLNVNIQKVNKNLLFKNLRNEEKIIKHCKERLNGWFIGLYRENLSLDDQIDWNLLYIST